MAEEVQQEIYLAFNKMKERDFSGAEQTLQDGLVRAQSNPMQAALYLSTLGVLHKLKNEPKEAWRYYEKAEKLMPDDPALKLIMSKFLLDQFAQYDTAIKRAEQALKLAKGSPSFEHQAHATLAMIYLKKGNKKEAIKMLDKAMEDDFSRIISAQNINCEILEAFMARNLEKERCQRYLEKALQLALTKKEQKQIQLFTKLLESLEITIQ